MAVYVHWRQQLRPARTGANSCGQRAQALEPVQACAAKLSGCSLAQELLRCSRAPAAVQQLSAHTACQEPGAHSRSDRLVRLVPTEGEGARAARDWMECVVGRWGEAVRLARSSGAEWGMLSTCSVFSRSCEQLAGLSGRQRLPDRLGVEGAGAAWRALQGRRCSGMAAQPCSCRWRERRRADLEVARIAARLGLRDLAGPPGPCGLLGRGCGRASLACLLAHPPGACRSRAGLRPMSPGRSPCPPRDTAGIGLCLRHVLGHLVGACTCRLQQVGTQAEHAAHRTCWQRATWGRASRQGVVPQRRLCEAVGPAILRPLPQCLLHRVHRHGRDPRGAAGSDLCQPALGGGCAEAALAAGPAQIRLGPLRRADPRSRFVPAASPLPLLPPLPLLARWLADCGTDAAL